MFNLLLSWSMLLANKLDWDILLTSKAWMRLSKWYIHFQEQSSWFHQHWYIIYIRLHQSMDPFSFNTGSQKETQPLILSKKSDWSNIRAISFSISTRQSNLVSRFNDKRIHNWVCVIRKFYCNPIFYNRFISKCVYDCDALGENDALIM